MKRDDVLVLDILLAAKDARQFIEGLDADRFASSRLHQNAVIRSLEVIGEAAGGLSAAFRATHSTIDWSSMTGMRNRLIHAYGDVRLDVVWDVAANKLPPLIEFLEQLVPPDGERPSISQ